MESQKVNRLKGEVPDGMHNFIDLDGNDSQGPHAIFPILKQVEGRDFKLIGTGFFISCFGLFLSAKHVLRDCFDDNNSEKYPICICQFFPRNQYRLRNIHWCSSHHRYDVAVALVEPDNGSAFNPCMQITTSPPAIGSKVVTYAYPKTEIRNSDFRQILNFEAAFYDGEIVRRFPGGRDRVMRPEPCYQTSMVIHNGASGGPVVGKSGKVFGINSTSFEGDTVSFPSRIDEVLRLQLPHFQLPSGQEIEGVNILDLAQSGWIDLE